MAYDYDKLYRETRNALGNPTDIFVDFFDRFEPERARVLDLGYGQGRDALFIARRGHNVIGVDISASGIADVVSYRPEDLFDIVLIDRTLHMLKRAAQLAVLNVILEHVDATGWLLIANEQDNIKAFEPVIAAHAASWTVELRRHGYLFAHRG